MIRFTSEFKIPIFEEGFLDYHKNHASLSIANKVVELFPFQKADDRDFISMSDYNQTIRGFGVEYPTNQLQPIRFRTEFFACSMDDYTKFKGEVLAAADLTGSRDLHLQILDIFQKFENNKTQENG